MTAPAVALRRWRACTVLFGGSLLLSATSLTVVLLASVLGPAFHNWQLYLDVLVEDNLPTWWSAALLATTALAHCLVGGIGRLARAPEASCWFISAAVLAVLALDDHTQLHERSERIGRQLVTGGTFPFYWLIPGAVAGLAVASALVWLAVRTRGRTRWLLVTGVTVLFGCALGLEIVQGFYMAAQNEGIGFTLTYHVEELGENIGALLLLAAAFSAVCITPEDGGLTVRYVRSLLPTPACPPSRPDPQDQIPREEPRAPAGTTS
ncbi:MAG: hypothetical protein ACRDSL_09525 [Pseudonocardiaceae bacterium]